MKRKQHAALQLTAAGFILAALPTFLGATPLGQSLGALFPLGVVVAFLGAALFLLD